MAIAAFKCDFCDRSAAGEQDGRRLCSAHLLDRSEAVPVADQIVAEFEGIFGKLTATERRWLIRRIAGQEV